MTEIAVRKAYGASRISISGGGRYDNLTGVFGMDGMSGVKEDGTPNDIVVTQFEANDNLYGGGTGASHSYCRKRFSA